MNWNPAETRRGSFFWGAPGRELVTALLIFLALSLLYYLQMVTDEHTFAGADLTIFFIPFRQTWIEQAMRGIFPLWNPYTSSGTPLLATLQPAILYPFSWFYLFFPFFWVFNLTIILHMGLAGFFMYWLMRGFGCSRAASAISGVGFMFGGYLFSLHHYLSTLLPVIWTPLLLLCYFGGLARNDKRLAVAAALVGCFMFNAGGVETCYQIFAWLVLLTLIPFPVFAETNHPVWRDRLVFLGVFGIFFLGLAAIQLFPTLELTRLSVRSAGLDSQVASSWGMKPRDVLQWFLIDPHGYLTFPRATFQEQIWLRACYTGAVPFFLGCFFWFTGGMRAVVCLLVMLVSFTLALGNEAALFGFFFDYLPFFNLFRYPIKMILPFILVLAMSSAWGWDALQRMNKEGRSPWIRWSWLILATGLMVGMELMEYFEEPLYGWMNTHGWGRPEFNLPEINLDNLERLFGFSAIFSLFLFLSLRFQKGKAVWTGMAVLVFGLDIFLSVHRFYWSVPAPKLRAFSPAGEFLLKDPDTFRVYVTPESESASGQDRIVRIIRGTRIGGIAIPVEFRNQPGIDQLGGWNVIRKRRLVQFLNKINNVPGPDRLNLLRMANVKYVVHGAKFPITELSRVFGEEPDLEENNKKRKTEDTGIEESRLRVYAVPDWLPRAYLVDQCRVALDDKGFDRWFFNPEFDPRKWVVLETSPPELPCIESTEVKLSQKNKVRILERRPDAWRLEVNTDRKQFLFLSDSYYPGWVAMVDGEEVPIYRANFTYRAVVVPPGKHEVVFDYRPLSFRLGAWITGITLVVAVVFWIRETRRRPRLDEALPASGV